MKTRRKTKNSAFSRLAQYYQTEHWRTLSRETRERIGRCQLDKNHHGPLEVHHNHYGNLGKEDPLDIIVLCSACHKLIAHRDHFGSAPAATETESLEEGPMIDLNTRDLSARLAGLVDAHLVGQASQQPRREYIGGSRLGEACLRKLQYEFFGTPTDTGGFDGKTLRIFHRGHQGEDWMAAWLRGSGFDLRTAGQDGQQFGFSVAGGRIAGHIDGALVNGPESFGPYPRLWENKVLGAKGWNKLGKDGLKAAYPVYYAQVQIYQAYMDLADNPALFTALNADTMEIYAEAVPFDPAAAQAISDKGASIIRACDAGELLPRLSDDPSWFECKFCSYHQRCHHGSNS